VPGENSLRPIFKMQDGLIVESELPKDEYYYVSNATKDHDLILFLGNEPNLNWEEYAESVVALACNYKANRLYTFCGLLDLTPYTREPKISCTCTSDEVKNEMTKYNVGFSNRNGSASFGQMLVLTCQKFGLEAVNFTVRTPYYLEYNIAVPYSPKSIKAVLVRLGHLTRLDIHFEELNKTIKDLEGKLNFVRQQNSQFNAFITELEKDYVETPYDEVIDISANEAIKFAEEFLKENRNTNNDK
jgi:proteasome assembly chaperone (PAC2) family protein